LSKGCAGVHPINRPRFAGQRRFGAQRPEFGPSINGDGRYVVFTSLADNLVGKDGNSSADIFLRDTCMGVTAECRPSTALVSVDNAGVQANSSSDLGKISGSGRFVAFVSAADNR